MDETHETSSGKAPPVVVADRPPLQVIGFTGSFGSGCTTAGEHLRAERGAHYISLSKMLRDELASTSGGTPPTRQALQLRGDQVREAQGPAELVRRAADEALRSGAEFCVVECIKNPLEVEWLREQFGDRFTLMAAMAQEPIRWSRVRTDYEREGLGRREFLLDDERDRDEETKHGQAVAICVDLADILIDNGQAEIDADAYRKKVLKFTDLALRRDPLYPQPDEVFMHQAFSARYGSRCIKRQVGAVVVDRRGQAVGSGTNENPLGTAPCVLEKNYQVPGGPCLRDIVRNAHFRQLADTEARCPVCGEPLGLVVGPPWQCETCTRASGAKTNLERFYFPDRAMTYCTAVHAEVAALLAAGSRAHEGTLYTTTFPCSPCAEQVVQCGIRRVVFSSMYSDNAGAKRLEIAGVKFEQFEGVRSNAFERLYRSHVPRHE